MRLGMALAGHLRPSNFLSLLFNVGRTNVAPSGFILERIAVPAVMTHEGAGRAATKDGRPP